MYSHETKVCISKGVISMKKVLISLITIIFVFSSSACTPQTKQSELFIQPSTFSKETNDVLALFENEIQFFDVSLDDSAKYYKIALWTYQDGLWYENTSTSGETESFGNRIAVMLRNDCYDLYTIDKNGHNKYSAPITNTNFKDATMIGNVKIENQTPILLNTETPILLKIGTKQNSLREIDITKDFRDLACDMGVAVTLTVFDEVQE